MMTSSNRNIFRITGPLWGEFTSHRWHGALMFSLIYAWTHDWVNNRDTFDVRRHHAHDDVSVMIVKYNKCWWPGDTKRVDTRRVSILMHKIKWLSRQIVLFFFHKNNLYPPKRSLGGVYWIHPVRLSVRPSVRPSVGRCPDDNSNSFQWI